MKCPDRSRIDRGVRFFGIALIVMVVAGCTTITEGGFSNAPLLGMLYDAAHHPCPGARVRLDDRQEAVSDAFGRFVFNEVARGLHRVVIRKPGYETHAATIDFESATQVLYVRLESAEQLTKRAESALAKEEYPKAEELLRRARTVDSKEPLNRYLAAVLSLRRGRYQESKEQLLDLLADGIEAPAVYLLLSDLYHVYLGRSDVAASALRRGLERTGDVTLKRRLDGLSPP